jgi:trans-L-3-hydroxyproline dehydratase
MSQNPVFPRHDQTAELDLVDVHVGGDVHRIVLGGVKQLPGGSVLEKMRYLKEHGDGLRQFLLNEPRGGHPSLFADLVVEPSLPGADAGFIIMESMGYPHISGTNTMSTVIALLETGKLPMREGRRQLHLEAPGGLIQVEAECRGGKVASVTYQAQTPSFVAEENLVAHVPGWGEVRFDLIWTGAFYPVVDTQALGFELLRTEEERLVQFAKQFVDAARRVCRPAHPVFGDEGPLSFVVFVGPLVRKEGSEPRLKVCCYEHPKNSVCRSPAGVPTTAAVVRLLRRREVAIGEDVRSISLFDTHLQARIAETADYHGHDGVRVSVTGKGWIIMRSKAVVDFADPLTPRDGLQELLAESVPSA